MMDIKPLAGIIYLRCEPHVCESRIKKRNRSEEAGIPFNYLDLLHRKHEEWLNDEGSQTKRVLVLDVSEDLIGNQKKYDELIDKAREFINSVLSG
jgi:deoxyadenosine/deoxycytidine kinase